MTPFDLAETYRSKGWTGTLPLGVESKFPPPGGFTGCDGRWPTPDDITGWRSRGFRAEGKHHDASNIALRLPAVAIGLDVDCYEGKTGADELARLVERRGPLPATWSSTSRDDGSRIMFYRVPSGVDPTSWPTGAGPAIEIIRHAHRYAVVWPSVHPETGQPYRWHRPDGSLADEGEVPGLGDLPELPATWLVGLTGYGSNGGHVKPGSRASRRETDEKARVWIAALPTGEPCAYVGRLTADLTGATRREDGNAYDTTRDAVMALLRAGETGHPGVRGVLLAGRAVYAETVADKRGGRTVAEGEFDRFTLGGVAKILDDPSDKAGRRCDCQSGPVTTLGEPPDDPWSDHEPAPVEDPGAEFERRNRYELRVNTKLDELRVLDEARDRLAAEKAAALTPTPFDAGLLEEILARPAEPPHRVDGLIPSQAGTLVVAQRKVGKTTFDLNLGRCLLTGQDFLGRFGVRPLDGRVGFLNFEVSAAQLARWADEAGVDRNRFYLVNLRGRRNPFGHEGDRTELAEQLRRHEVEALFVDPFSRAYTGKSQNDPGEVAAWLADLDRFARTDAGVVDIILNAHAGWDGERSRGASALEDWADSIITLVTDPDDRTIRYLRAMGRDIDVDEDRLHYDPHTRALSLTGDGNRASVHATKRLDDQVAGLVELVTAEPGIITGGIEAGLREMGFPLQRGDTSKAARAAVDRGLIERVPGKRRAQHHYLKGQTPPVTPSDPDYPQGSLVSTPDSSIGGGATDSLLLETTSTPSAVIEQEGTA